ncbi:MAG: 4a-hydroxytetrahydrobiopterin dehydratase [Acidobacteriota bacterium]
MAKLSADRVESLLRTVPGWAVAGDAIVREFAFPGFPDAVAFVVRLGFAAEAADHHPDLTINYKRVRVTYSTHSAGGLTEKDFEGATMANRLAGS